jgi:hypothetical protein
MVKIARGILAVVLGFVTFSGVVAFGEHVGHLVYPPPPGFDHHDPHAVEGLPIGALVAVLVAWGVGAFAGAWVAARLAPGAKMAFGLGIGVIGLVAAIAIMRMLPHPKWMWVVGVVEFLPLAYLGAWLAVRNTATNAVGTWREP